jgi:VWFA-related protein
MIRLSLAVILLSGLFVAGSERCVRASGAPEKEAEQAAEAFVHVYFTDYEGRRITDLELDELEILVDARPVKIKRIIQPDVPFDVGLLMDVSPSTEKEVDQIRQATSDFISYFPPQSRLLLLTFDSEVYVDCDWTTDRKKMDEAIWEYGLHKGGSKTILREARVAAAEQKFMPRKPRTAMILFSDGDDTGTKDISKEDSVAYLQKAQVLTYCIQHFSLEYHWKVHHPAPESPDVSRMPSPGGSKAGPIFIGGPGTTERDIAEYKVNTIHENAVAYLGNVSRAGGGQHIQLATINDLAKAYERVASDLLEVYTIVFESPLQPGTQLHSVSVRTSREDVIAHFRPTGLWLGR